MEYNEWLREWLELFVKPTVKTQTYNRYAQIVKNQISPYIGKCDMEKLSAIELQKFIVGLSTEKKLAGNTVNLVVTVVQKSCRVAEEIGVVKHQCSGKIKRPKIIEKSVGCFSRKEQNKIEEYILQNRNKVKLFGILFCLYSGLRIGELLSLKWTDINFRDKTMTIQRSCRDEYLSGKLMKVFDTPKTEKSKRIVPIPKQIVPILRDIKCRTKSDFVVSDGERGVGVRSYQKTFACLLEKLDIPHKGFHSLRHTFATRAIECGMDVKTLSEILGHKNPEITLRRYAHSLFEHKTEMMNMVGRTIEKKFID